MGGPFKDNYFKLFAQGTDFNVDAYVEQSSLRFDSVWHLGEPHLRSSGCEIVLGDGDTTRLEEQERIAVEFLETNEEALRELAGYEGVDSVILGLHYRASAHMAAFCMEPSEGLMYFALRTGVSPVFYVELVWEYDTIQRQGITEPDDPADGH